MSKALSPATVNRIRDRGAAYKTAAAEAGRRGQKVPDGAPIRLADGAGLYLIVEPSGAARWLFLFRWRGKLKEMGLGGISTVGQKLAREKAQDARDQLGRGANPIEARRAKGAIPTFGEVADEVLAEVRKGFKNPKHTASWERGVGAPRRVKRRGAKAKWEETVRASFATSLRSIPVDQITVTDVLAVLKPLWSTTHVTAVGLRGQIAHVLDAAKAAGHRAGENPAAWDGNLKHFLSPPRKLTRGHLPAVPYTRVADFLIALRSREALAARALEFLILTAVRSAEVIHMAWPEVDLEARTWTVPGARTKTGKPHIIPLSAPVLKILDPLQLLRGDDAKALVFPTGRGKPHSENALGAVIDRMNSPVVIWIDPADGRPAVPHGFRSTFRDWAGDLTSYPRDLAEQALGHAVGDEVERAYRRSSALERRRAMMDDWARYCDGGAQVIALAEARTA